MAFRSFSAEVCFLLDHALGRDSCSFCRRWSGGVCLLSCVGGRDHLASGVLRAFQAWQHESYASAFLEKSLAKNLTSSPRVVHCKQAPYDVYIGRPGKWGNPFSIGRDGDRDEVIAKYADYIIDQPGLLAEVHLLAGKVLGCWCAPKACHGDFLARLSDQCNVINKGGV